MPTPILQIFNVRCVTPLVVFAIVFVTGCGSDSQNVDLPDPGTLELVAVEVLDTASPIDGRNLIPNARFDDWYAGSPVPTGFARPIEDRSTVQRAVDPAGAGYIARQSWHGPDNPDALETLFRVRADKPSTSGPLRLAVATTHETKGVAVFSLWQERRDQPILHDPSALWLMPGAEGVKHYSRTLPSPPDQAQILAVYAPTDDRAPTIVWHDWYLGPAGS